MPLSCKISIFFLFSHRREKQIWLLRTLEKKMLRKWSREPENWMLNMKLPLSSLHLCVLIANFFVFMVLFPKSHALILQILYPLQCLSLPKMCSFISYAFQYFCVLYLWVTCLWQNSLSPWFFEACAEVLAFICFICCCFGKKPRFYSCIIVVSYFKFIWLLENKLT